MAETISSQQYPFPHLPYSNVATTVISRPTWLTTQFHFLVSHTPVYQMEDARESLKPQVGKTRDRSVA